MSDKLLDTVKYTDSPLQTNLAMATELTDSQRLILAEKETSGIGAVDARSSNSLDTSKLKPDQGSGVTGLEVKQESSEELNNFYELAPGCLTSMIKTGKARIVYKYNPPGNEFGTTLEAYVTFDAINSRVLVSPADMAEILDKDSNFKAFNSKIVVAYEQAKSELEKVDSQDEQYDDLVQLAVGNAVGTRPTNPLKPRVEDANKDKFATSSDLKFPEGAKDAFELETMKKANNIFELITALARSQSVEFSWERAVRTGDLKSGKLVLPIIFEIGKEPCIKPGFDKELSEDLNQEVRGFGNSILDIAETLRSSPGVMAKTSGDLKHVIEGVMIAKKFGTGSLNLSR